VISLWLEYLTIWLFFFSLVLIVDARRRVLGLNKFLVVQTFFNIEVFLFVVPEIDFKLFEFQELP